MENKTVKNIAVLASGSGSNFEAIVSACESEKDFPGQVVLLIFDRKEAYCAVRAKNHGIEAIYLNKFLFKDDEASSREEKADAAMNDILVSHDVDLVVLAGYLSKVGKKTVGHFKNQIINTHPALIPSFCGMGMFGHNVHEAVVNYGAKISGCTIHFIDENMDTGPIISQEAVPVFYSDTPEDVANRVLQVEHKLLPNAVKLFCQDRLTVSGRRVEIKK